jgi:hypothetical protein
LLVTEQRSGSIVPLEVAIQGGAGNRLLTLRFQDLVDHSIAAQRLISLELHGAIEYRVSFLAHFASIAAGLSPHSQDPVFGDPFVLAA